MPGRGLYLKMKLFLNRDSRDQVDGLLELFLGLAAEADDEVAGDRHARHRLADAGQHLAILLDRVAPLHPLEHVVRSRSAPARAGTASTFGRSRTACEQVVGHVLGEVRDELDPLEAVDVVQSCSRSDSRVVRPSGSRAGSC